MYVAPLTRQDVSPGSVFVSWLTECNFPRVSVDNSHQNFLGISQVETYGLRSAHHEVLSQSKTSAVYVVLYHEHLVPRSRTRSSGLPSFEFTPVALVAYKESLVCKPTHIIFRRSGFWWRKDGGSRKGSPKELQTYL